MAKINSVGKIKVGKLYELPNKDVVRVVRINVALNNVVVYNYHSHSNNTESLDSAESSFSQLFKLADVARFVGKKPETIRKYESLGLISKVRKIMTNPDGRAQTRVYSQEDIDQLRAFFETRRPVGRPRTRENKKYSKQEVKQKLDHIKMKEKLNG